MTGMRREQLVAVLEDVARRRANGESLSDSDVIARFPELMPDLNTCLSDIHLVAHAMNVADQERENATLSTDNFSAPTSLPHIPRYRLLAEIHRGGQGTVYRAIQESTGREVAVKIIHRGAQMSEADFQRFRREVQILAGLRHPYIITIHDSGIHEGHCYLAMDLVHGRPVDSVVADEVWPIRRIVSAFANICDAVSAAHSQGIVHRDLKPNNVLIDAQGEPRVLDFGLARDAADHFDDDKHWNTVTHSGQFVGSLPWASPEQTSGGSRNSDLRSDVYTLGMLLYYLLARTFPYEVRGDLRATLSNIADAPPIRPRNYRKDVDADLELIVMTCLEKDPSRRYQNAIDLAADVRRYLAREPLVARTPSRSYQLRKLLHRHRIVFGFIVTMFITIAGFSTWLLYMNSRILKELQNSKNSEQMAEQREHEAKREAKTHSTVKRFLIDDLLVAAMPQVSRGREVTVKEVFQNAKDRLGAQFEDDPLIRASILTTIGQLHRAMGQYPEAIEPLREATHLRIGILGPHHADTIQTQSHLLAALRESGRSSEAEPLAVQLCDSLEKVYGPNDRQTLQALFELAQNRVSLGRVSDANELLELVHDRSQTALSEDDLLRLSALSELASYGSLARNSPSEAEAAHRSVYERVKARLGMDHPTTLHFALKYANSPQVNRTSSETGELLQAILDGQQAVLGATHPDAHVTRLRLATHLESQGALGEAAMLCETTTDSLRASLGVDHPTTLGAMDRLGYFKAAQRRFVEAVQIHNETLDARIRSLGEQHYSVAQSYDSLGASLSRIGHFAEAVDAHLQALEIYQNNETPDSEIAWSLRCIVHALAGDERTEEARPFGVRLLTIRRAEAARENASEYHLNCAARELLDVSPKDLRDPIAALEYAERAYELTPRGYPYNRYILALALEANDRISEAIPLLEEALASTTLDESDFRTQYETAMVRMFEAMGEIESAEMVYRRTLAARRERDRFIPLDVAASLDDLGEWLIRHDRLTEAEELLRESLQLRLGDDGGESWKTAWTMALLSRTLSGTKSNEARDLVDQSMQLLSEDEWTNTLVLGKVERMRDDP